MAWTTGGSTVPSPDSRSCRRETATADRRGDADMLHAIRQALLLNGVDCMGVDGLTSAVHTSGDVERTVEAFDGAISLLKRDGIIA